MHVRTIGIQDRFLYREPAPISSSSTTVASMSGRSVVPQRRAPISQAYLRPIHPVALPQLPVSNTM